MRLIRFFNLKKPKWISWHLFPSKDSPIISIYEFLLFILSLLLCLWAYSKVNSITTQSYEIEAECLNAKDIYRNVQKMPSAKIKFLLPRTETFKDSAINSITFKTFNPRIDQRDSLLRLLNYTSESQNKRDSLIRVFYKNFKKEDCDSLCCLYYVKTNYSLNKGLLYTPKFKLKTDSIGEALFKGKFINKQRITDVSFSQEIYNLMSSLSSFTNKWDISEKGGISMSNPGWFAGFDISQAYYDMRLKTTTIDSLTLEVNFVGATDFSRMTPEPDIITMSSIIFSHPEKIKIIKENGLRFHTTFKEMENRQTIRIFFLTAIMCSLLSLLLIFIIVGLYKVVNGIKNNR